MRRLAFGVSVALALCVLGASTPAHAQSASSYWYGNRSSGYRYVSPQPSPRYNSGYWYQYNYRYSPRYYQRRGNTGYGYSDPNNYRYYSPGAGYLLPPQYRRPGYYGPSAHPPYGGFQPDQRSRYWNYGYQGQPTYPPYWTPRRHR
jgi:hypothetical protein